MGAWAALILVVGAEATLWTSEHGSADSRARARAARRAPERVDGVRVGGYLLRRTRSGYEYRDARFNAQIALDGSVSLDDRRLSFALSGSQVGGRPVEQAAHPHPRTGLVPDYRRDEAFFDRVFLAGGGGRFDLTDELMRFNGRDPYRYEKARFLAATFDMRMEMAVADRRQILRVALAELPARLEALWRDPRFTPRERRYIVYRLWVETDDRPEAGGQARAAIESFVRLRLPAGSAEAFGNEELEALNRNQERRFRPY